MPPSSSTNFGVCRYIWRCLALLLVRNLWPLRVLAQGCVRRGHEEPRYEYLAEWLDTDTVFYPANQSPLGWLAQRKGGWSTRASTTVDIGEKDMTECIALYIHGQLNGSEALPSNLRSTTAQKKYIAENRTCVREDATLRHEHERVLRIFDMFECMLRFTALPGASKPCAAVRCAEMVAPMNVGTPRALDLPCDDVNRAWAISRQIANSDQALFRGFEQHARKRRAVTAKNSVALFRAFARYVAGDIGAAINHGGCRHNSCRGSTSFTYVPLEKCAVSHNLILTTFQVNREYLVPDIQVPGAPS